LQKKLTKGKAANSGQVSQKLIGVSCSSVVGVLQRSKTITQHTTTACFFLWKTNKGETLLATGMFLFGEHQQRQKEVFGVQKVVWWKRFLIFKGLV